MSASCIDRLFSALNGRYFDGQTATLHAAILELRGGVLRIAGAEGETLAEWPRAAVEGAGDLAADGSATLRCRVRTGRVVTADQLVLRGLRRRNRDVWWALAAALALLLVVAALAASPPLFATAAVLLPERWQDRLGDSAVRAAFGDARSCQGAAGVAALDRLASRLAQAGGLARPPRIEVLDLDMVNAFALPARRIVVMRGLIGRMHDGAELAGVVAHEAGHVLVRDPMVGFLRAQALAGAVALSGAGQGAPATLLGLSYSRQAEARADANALRLLRAAGLRADGLGRALGRLSGPGEPAIGWLSDHPLTPERIAATETSPQGEPPLTDAEWAAVQAICARD